MYFASDNWAGASPRVRDALLAACSGVAPAYGGDEVTKALTQKMSELFDHEVAVALVPTGTAANALGLSALCPPYGLIYAHWDAHIIREECSAVEFFTHGAKIVGIAGEAGRISAESLKEALADSPASGASYPANAVISLTQATECGTLYRPSEIAALSSIAKAHGMGVHMDGARFANAVATLGCKPADITWKAGIDVLSFGGTKNGALMAEAVVFFDPSKADKIEWLRKRGGHIMSKMRPLAAQFLALIEGDHWLDLARHSNAMAADLANGFQVIGHSLIWPREINEVFVVLPDALIAKLRGAGAVFYDWPKGSLPKDKQPREGETAVRLVSSFATTKEEVERFIALLREGSFP